LTIKESLLNCTDAKKPLIFKQENQKQEILRILKRNENPQIKSTKKQIKRG
jgi:hypothetical protein